MQEPYILLQQKPIKTDRIASKCLFSTWALKLSWVGAPPFRLTRFEEDFFLRQLPVVYIYIYIYIDLCVWFNNLLCNYDYLRVYLFFLDLQRLLFSFFYGDK